MGYRGNTSYDSGLSNSIEGDSFAEIRLGKEKSLGIWKEINYFALEKLSPRHFHGIHVQILSRQLDA